MGGYNTIDTGAVQIGQLSADIDSAVQAPLNHPEAWLNEPTVAGETDASAAAYVADTGNRLVRRVDLVRGTIATVLDSIDGEPLGRPAGLAVDSATGLLWVADREDRSVIEFHTSSKTSRRLAFQDENGEPLQLFDPRDLVFFDFPSGAAYLFVVDRGQRNDDVGVASQGPRVLAHRLPVRGFSEHTFDLGAEIDLGFALDQVDLRFNLRQLSAILGRREQGGDFRLFVAADIGECFGDNCFEDYLDNNDEEISSFIKGVFCELDLEHDLYDGLNDEEDCPDHDQDGVDFADPESAGPLNVQVFALRFPPEFTGFDDGPVVVPVARCVTGFRKIQIHEGDQAEFCPPFSFPSETPPSDIPDLIVQDMAFTEDGDLLLLNANPSSEFVYVVQLEDLDGDGGCDVTNFYPVAGTPQSLGTLFDGRSPTATRFFQPRSIAIDALDNLILVDTQTNRIRRVWIGDELPLEFDGMP